MQEENRMSNNATLRKIQERFIEIRLMLTKAKDETTLAELNMALLDVEQKVSTSFQMVLEFVLESQKQVFSVADVVDEIEANRAADSEYTVDKAIESIRVFTKKFANSLDIKADARPVEDYKDTHLMSWLTQGYMHCQYGSKQWCEGYLMSAYNYIQALEAERGKISYILPNLSDEQKDELRVILKENEEAINPATLETGQEIYDRTVFESMWQRPSTCHNQCQTPSDCLRRPICADDGRV